MKWHEIRERFPEQWLLVEAVKAHSEQDQRVLDNISVLDPFPDSVTAMRAYARLHHEEPRRELYVLHTHRETLQIAESRWLGIRGI